MSVDIDAPIRVLVKRVGAAPVLEFLNRAQQKKLVGLPLERLPVELKALDEGAKGTVYLWMDGEGRLEHKQKRVNFQLPGLSAAIVGDVFFAGHRGLNRASLAESYAKRLIKLFASGALDVPSDATYPDPLSTIRCTSWSQPYPVVIVAKDGGFDGSSLANRLRAHYHGSPSAPEQQRRMLLLDALESGAVENALRQAPDDLIDIAVIVAAGNWVRCAEQTFLCGLSLAPFGAAHEGRDRPGVVVVDRMWLADELRLFDPDGATFLRSQPSDVYRMPMVGLADGIVVQPMAWLATKRIA